MEAFGFEKAHFFAIPITVKNSDIFKSPFSVMEVQRNLKTFECKPFSKALNPKSPL